MLKLDFLASFSLIFLTDLFLMLPDADDEVEVLDAAPLFTEEDVPDGSFLSSGSCCARKLFFCSGSLVPL